MVEDWSQLCCGLKVCHLIVVSRVSSKESKRMPLFPDWSQLWCSKTKSARHAYRNLCKNLKSLAGLEVSHLLGVSRASSQESKRTSLVPDWTQLCCSQYKSGRHEESLCES